MLIKDPKTAGPGRPKFWQRWPRENLLALAAVVAVLIVSLILVRLFKNPNQMGVIESQSMDMTNMRPPQGAVPVALSRVEYRDVAQVLTYTGTVRAYEDQDVVARISATLTNMLVYPGDRVSRGQVIAQLDAGSSEYATRAEEARLGAVAAQHNVRIAEQELQQRQQESEAIAAQVAQAQQEVAGAQADVTYWTAEIVRQKRLLDARVVSQEEYDRELARSKAANATLEQAKQRVVEQRNRRESALEAVDAARHHIIHQTALAQQASAAARTANIITGYTTIRALGNGVVTQRLVSPGVVVQPGQTLMRIAVIDRVRVQASVAGSDAQQVQVGDPVQIRPSQGSTEKIFATVTAVFPAADPTARTTIVESVIPNINYRWLPGQFAVMDITASSQRALSVPNSAIVRLNGQAHVWRASGNQQKTVQLVRVEVGSVSSTHTQILAGLQAGDQVVVQGHANLQPGMTVVATEWTAEGPKALPTAAATGALRLDSNNNWTARHQLRGMSLSLSMRDKPAKGANNAVVLTLQDAGAKPVKGVQVRAKTSMPSMNMAGPTLSGTTDDKGTVQLSTFFMSGPWRVETEVGSGAQAQQFVFDIEVL
jgi:RND family efflux transporter MFP subunit